MTEFALPCIACGAELRNVDSGSTNQPHEGTTFESYGHYGSTAFDPMDGSYIELNVCDPCIKRLTGEGKVMFGRTYRMVVTSLDGWGSPMRVGRQRVHRELTTWDGKHDEFDPLHIEPAEVGTDAWDTEHFKVEWEPTALEVVQQQLTERNGQ